MDINMVVWDKRPENSFSLLFEEIISHSRPLQKNPTLIWDHLQKYSHKTIFGTETVKQSSRDMVLCYFVFTFCSFIWTWEQSSLNFAGLLTLLALVYCQRSRWIQILKPGILTAEDNKHWQAFKVWWHMKTGWNVADKHAKTNQGNYSQQAENIKLTQTREERWLDKIQLYHSCGRVSWDTAENHLIILVSLKN